MEVSAWQCPILEGSENTLGSLFFLKLFYLFIFIFFVVIV